MHLDMNFDVDQGSVLAWSSIWTQIQISMAFSDSDPVVEFDFDLAVCFAHGGRTSKDPCIATWDQCNDAFGRMQKDT